MLSSQSLPDPLFFSGHRSKLPPRILLLPTPPMSPLTPVPPITQLESILSFYTPARASTYDSSPFHVSLAAAVVDPLALSEGTRVLDLATGTGLVAIECARRGAEVVGVDASGEMLEVARGKAGGEGVRWVEGDVAQPNGWVDGVGMGDGKWERVVCCSAMTFPPPTESLLAWSHLLAISPNSTITFDVPTPISSPRNVLLSSIAQTYGLTPRFNRRWITSEQSVRDIVAATGTLEVRSLTGTGILSTKTVKLSGTEVWEESVKITNMNPFPEALSLGIISPAQFAEARQSFADAWTAKFGASAEVEETMENWILVCGLKDESS